MSIKLNEWLPCIDPQYEAKVFSDKGEKTYRYIGVIRYKPSLSPKISHERAVAWSDSGASISSMAYNIKMPRYETVLIEIPEGAERVDLEFSDGHGDILEEWSGSVEEWLEANGME